MNRSAAEAGAGAPAANRQKAREKAKRERLVTIGVLLSGRHGFPGWRGRRRRLPPRRGRGSGRGTRKSPRRPSGAHGRDQDRKSVVEGKSVSVRVDLGGRRNIKTI